LTYHPPREAGRDDRLLDLHALGRNAEQVLAGQAVEVLPELLRAGGSPGGARPKVLVGIQGDRIISGEEDLPAEFLACGGEPWIIKFATQADARDAGCVEYAYSLMARAAGLDMPDTRLFEVQRGRSLHRYFGVKRFDRAPGNRRIHIHTFADLVHANFRIPSTDYADLFKVTRSLTRSHRDVLRLFRLMVFNVAAHNRDDHAKNFAFLLDGQTGEWSLTPAYDLTFAPGPGGEHTTTLLGQGRHPTRAQCLTLADRAGLKPREAGSIFDQVNAAIARWRDFAEQASCTNKVASAIARATGPL
jgi:serine/threonine-protein kinase HipA